MCNFVKINNKDSNEELIGGQYHSWQSPQQQETFSPYQQQLVQRVVPFDQMVEKTSSELFVDFILDTSY